MVYTGAIEKWIKINDIARNLIAKFAASLLPAWICTFFLYLEIKTIGVPTKNT
tara:strand:- start:450 stop:608 length:159 start_codon:yes stop_codon:yes gene_type:complete